jgi:hypothetical protein
MYWAVAILEKKKKGTHLSAGVSILAVAVGSLMPGTFRTEGSYEGHIVLVEK